MLSVMTEWVLYNFSHLLLDLLLRTKRWTSLELWRVITISYLVSNSFTKIKSNFLTMVFEVLHDLISSHLCALIQALLSFHFPLAHLPATWATVYSSIIPVSLLLWGLCTVPRAQLGLWFPLRTLRPIYLSRELSENTLSNITTIPLHPRYSILEFFTLLLFYSFGYLQIANLSH